MAVRALVGVVAPILTVGVLGLGCREAPVEAPPDAAPSTNASIEAPVERYGLLERLATCDFQHEGVVLDLGSDAATPHRGFDVPPFEDALDVQRAGATFTRALSRKMSWSFWLDTPRAGVRVSARVVAGTAQRATVDIDGRSLGVMRFPSEVGVASTGALPTELTPGHHTVTFTFAGKRQAAEARAEFDWLRIAPNEPTVGTYSAPTLQQLVVDRALQGSPKRAVALRAPSSVRCTLWVGAGASVRTALGYWGAGRGTAELRAHADGDPPVVLARREVEGAEDATWQVVEASLDAFRNRLVALELSAVEATTGGRLLFGEPAAVRADPSEDPAALRAKTAVLVVLSSVERSRLPPWGSGEGLASFAEIARTGARFSLFRAPSTVQGAAFASLLTGLPPREHSVEDPAARLPASVGTLADFVKQASGRTAFFTSVPPSFAAFGFHRSWDRYDELSPVLDLGAALPFERAAEWLEKDLAEPPRRRLVVIHARGAHPPWDVDRDDAAKAGPKEYGGGIGPRRGAIELAAIRTRRSPARRKISEDDVHRIRALEMEALAGQGIAFGKLVTTLKDAGAWDDALVVVAGDVGPGDAPSVPYDPAGPLTEDRLIAPLLVKFPRRRFAGQDVGTPATSVDVAVTILEALDVRPPSGSSAVSLAALAAGREPLGGREVIATLGNAYATRWGEWLLVGEFRRRPRLCQLSVDPACVDDIFESRPIAARALWQRTFDAERKARQRAGGRAVREPATIDAATGAALEVWGH